MISRHGTPDLVGVFVLAERGVGRELQRDAEDAVPRVGEAPQLEKVNQSGEFKRGTIGEVQETYRIETFGRVIGITRQVLINDDLDAFTRVPALFGTSAATLESDVVWGIFTANPAMADGTTLFHAGHKNLTGAGAAVDVAGLAKARTAMAQQHGLDGKTLPNVRPAYLVVPSALELAAEQLLAQNIVPAKAADVVPSSIRSLAVIAEPVLKLDMGIDGDLSALLDAEIVAAEKAVTTGVGRTGEALKAGRGALRRQDAGEPGDRRRPLRALKHPHAGAPAGPRLQHCGAVTLKRLGRGLPPRTPRVGTRRR
jgi:hypothetical protein